MLIQVSIPGKGCFHVSKKDGVCWLPDDGKRYWSLPLEQGAELLYAVVRAADVIAEVEPELASTKGCCGGGCK